MNEFDELINIIALNLFELSDARPVEAIFRVNVENKLFGKKSVHLDKDIRFEKDGAFISMKDLIDISDQVSFEMKISPYLFNLYEVNKKMSNDVFSFLIISISDNGEVDFEFEYDQEDISFSEKVNLWSKSLGSKKE